jgi:hypothetical protein
MTIRTTSAERLGLPDTDADIDRFIIEHHGEFAAKLAAAQAEIARGEVSTLEPLEELLKDARTPR